VPESASAIVMNPPYITIAEMDSLPENVKKEPSLALFGGEDGLDFYRRIRDISPDATLIFEIGAKQGTSLQEIFGGGEIIKDYCGFDRVFLLEK
jgi:release factor glutamine methyltransferase